MPIQRRAGDAAAVLREASLQQQGQRPAATVGLLLAERDGRVQNLLGQGTQGAVIAAVFGGRQSLQTALQEALLPALQRAHRGNYSVRCVGSALMRVR